MMTHNLEPDVIFADTDIVSGPTPEIADLIRFNHHQQQHIWFARPLMLQARVDGEEGPQCHSEALE